MQASSSGPAEDWPGKAGTDGCDLGGIGRQHPAARHAPGVLASAATGIGGYIEECGGDVDRIFGDARILPDLAGSPTLKLRLSAFVQLFEESARQTGNDNFGLWFGNRFQPRDLGMWGYAAISAPTLGSALECLVRLFRYHQESSVMRLCDDRQRPRPARIPHRRAADRRAPAGRRAVARHVPQRHPRVLRRRAGRRRRCISSIRSRRWRASTSRPSARRSISRQPTNALLFRPDVLARPMPARDLRLLAVMQTCLEQLGSQAAEGGHAPRPDADRDPHEAARRLSVLRGRRRRASGAGRRHAPGPAGGRPHLQGHGRGRPPRPRPLLPPPAPPALLGDRDAPRLFRALGLLPRLPPLDRRRRRGRTGSGC